MAKHFIFVVENAINAFTTIMEGQRINYSYVEEGLDIKELFAMGDRVLIASPQPQPVIHTSLIVQAVGDHVSFAKDLEVGKPVLMVDKILLEELREKIIVEIDEKQFNSIRNIMIEHVRGSVDEVEAEEPDETLRLRIGENVIVYGVPGCGKSYYIQENYGTDDRRIERVVFHPDYTNTDFVGQIVPAIEFDTTTKKNIVNYKFEAGPFTRIIEKAYWDPSNMYYLIIEEINRGNAAAIFGEAFQLLDRRDGESEFGINNEYMAEHIFVSKTDTEEQKNEKKRRKVKVPGNLTILATMNTADQNVFILDTAFKRRWKMKSIANDISKCNYRKQSIGSTNITWEAFVKTINNKIIEIDDGFNNEDKRLGAFFAREEEVKDQKLFAEKVIMYLWDDAFKNSRDDVFAQSEKMTLETLVIEFEKRGMAIFKPTVGFESSAATELNDETDRLL